ncbi:hypothetical protein [Paenibacillus glycanilyticus]|uniref:hypothetical protein n=1 Tax=Paenibacillus glycanilyticus TaxID=126569 RepID=UPI0019101282|nr:hypothetical protein [Paenibacillus glycanilyticus]
MKKNLITAAVAAILITVVPLTTNAESTGAAKTHKASNKYGFLLNQTVTFNGQGSTSFEYNSEAGEVHTLIQNTGPKSLTYQLVDPSGNVWQSGMLDPGNEYKSNYIWDNVQNGKWYFEINNKDGSVGSYKVLTQWINDSFNGKND